MDRSIIVDHLVKNFEVNGDTSGVIGFLKSLIGTKKKTVHALRSLSFAIQPGEVVGIVGPKGAGKTTMLKILSGLLSPTSGFVEVLEHDPWERKSEFLRQISLVAGRKDQFWWELSAQETLELNRAIYGISSHEYEENLNELVEIFDLGKLLNIPIVKLSLAQRASVELATELIHKPKVLLLDEPTLGLELASKQKIRDSIYQYNQKYGTTVIMATSNTDDLIDTVRRVVVMNEGNILFDGALEDLITKFSNEKVINTVFLNDNGLSSLDQIGKVKKINFPRVSIYVPRSTAYVAASELIQNYPVESLTIEELPVIEIIRNMNTKNMNTENVK